SCSFDKEIQPLNIQAGQKVHFPIFSSMARTSDKIKVNLSHNTEPINFENSRKIILGSDGPTDAHIFAYSNNSPDHYDYPPDDPYFSEEDEDEPEPKGKNLKRNSQKRIDHIPIRCLGSQIEITIQDEE